MAAVPALQHPYQALSAITGAPDESINSHCLSRVPQPLIAHSLLHIPTHTSWEEALGEPYSTQQVGHHPFNCPKETMPPLAKRTAAEITRVALNTREELASKDKILRSCPPLQNKQQ